MREDDHKCYVCGSTVPETGWYDDTPHDALGFDCENEQCGRYDIRISDWPLYEKLMTSRFRQILMFFIRHSPDTQRRLFDKRFLEQITR